MVFETENIEFKVQFTDDIYKEVVAFANTDGGVIYVGFDNSGNAVGIANVDDTYTRITNGIRDAIAPDVTVFVRYTLQDGKIIKISVGEGSFKPYYLKAKGLKPSGVYVRQGASSVPASLEQIRRMIKLSDGDVFEEMRSMEQNLTFDCAAGAFERYNVEFTREKYRILGLTDGTDNMYTNLAQIVSDQCSHTVKIAVFANTAKTEFRDSKEFVGSVFKQLDEAFAYLTLCNKTASSIKGLVRTDRADYPEEALREALLNALVHRDYGFSGSIIINVTDSEMEFISIGGLLPGLSPEDIKSGISQPRNKHLAEVFHRLRLIESYGTGIRKIYSLYENQAVQPRIEVSPNTFKIVLPNMNSSANRGKSEKTELTPQLQTVLSYIEDNGHITDAQVQELLGVKHTRSYTLMKGLLDAGFLVSVGRGADKIYIKK